MKGRLTPLVMETGGDVSRQCLHARALGTVRYDQSDRGMNSQLEECMRTSRLCARTPLLDAFAGIFSFIPPLIGAFIAPMP